MTLFVFMLFVLITSFVVACACACKAYRIRKRKKYKEEVKRRKLLDKMKLGGLDDKGNEKENLQDIKRKELKAQKLAEAEEAIANKKDENTEEEGVEIEYNLDDSKFTSFKAVSDDIEVDDSLLFDDLIPLSSSFSTSSPSLSFSSSDNTPFNPSSIPFYPTSSTFKLNEQSTTSVEMLPYQPTPSNIPASIPTSSLSSSSSQQPFEEDTSLQNKSDACSSSLDEPTLPKQNISNQFRTISFGIIPTNSTRPQGTLPGFAPNNLLDKLKEEENEEENRERAKEWKEELIDCDEEVDLLDFSEPPEDICEATPTINEDFEWVDELCVPMVEDSTKDGTSSSSSPSLNANNLEEMEEMKKLAANKKSKGGKNQKKNKRHHKHRA
eukprot:MONOS_4111.1-p1 / transcript=MONOS_4111.1 / gene=MONOS_4111 / organism=Monocercomonoides_exilis_PA203 / gene_product=unspecified product / transcript_product=unspecified product / location=Mono_scaffold00105:11037-12268(+) / protein_length=382 / sequence_SO=supercontig / SO=protein_coding / is_pseudo=false